MDHKIQRLNFVLQQMLTAVSDSTAARGLLLPRIHCEKITVLVHVFIAVVTYIKCERADIM